MGDALVGFFNKAVVRAGKNNHSKIFGLGFQLGQHLPADGLHFRQTFFLSTDGFVKCLSSLFAMDAHLNGCLHQGFSGIIQIYGQIDKGR